MNINTEHRMYKIDSRVYIGTCQLVVKDQRGKLYVNYKSRQVNVKDIPVLPAEENDCVYNYIFGGGSAQYPCSAMEYWIYRHRLRNRISVKDYAIKFSINTKKPAYKK